MSDTSDAIQRFLQRAPIEQSRIVLDGCGPNGAVQYEPLSLLGIERVLLAQEVHVVSSSTFAYLFFLARHRGELALSRRQLRSWDAIIRTHHKVIPGLTLLRSLARMARGQSVELPVEGLANAFRQAVSARFAALTVGDLPKNVHCWLYDVERRQLQVAHAGSSELAQMPLSVLVQAAANVPRIFGSVAWNGQRLSDPIYSPLRRELYTELRSGTNVLLSNIFKAGETASTVYVRPTRMLHGRTMLLTDFGLFLSGLPNFALGAAVERGLYETAPL